MAWTSAQVTQRGFVYQVLLIILVMTVGVATNAFGWTVKHTAMRGGGSVDQHEWYVNPEGATIRDIHICLASVPDDKVPGGKDGVTEEENAAFEADLYDDWGKPSIYYGPGDTEVNWTFSVTRDRTSGRVCLNFYGSDPLPLNQLTIFSIRLTRDANQFEKGNTADWVTDDDADVIATSDGDESIDDPIPDGTKENVGGPKLTLMADSVSSVKPAEKLSVTWGQIRSSY